MCGTDVVIAAQPLVGTECLVVHRCQRGLVDVGSWNIPPWREAGLVKNQRPLGIGNSSVTMVDHEPTRGFANVDAMVAVGSMTQDAFVFLIEGVHGRPGEGHTLP